MLPSVGAGQWGLPNAERRKIAKQIKETKIGEVN